MSSASAYLLSRSGANRVQRLVRDGRKPGQLIALVGALAWFGFLLYSRQGAPPPATAANGFAASAGALGLAIMVVGSWVLGTGSTLVQLTAAERMLLLPAPMTAAQLVDIKVARLQVEAIGNALFWTLLVGSAGDAAGLVRRFLAFWVVLSTLQLHRAVAARFRNRAVAAAGVRRIVAMAGLLLIVLPLILAGGTDAGGGSMAAMLENPVIQFVLWPFLQVIRPLAVGEASGWWRAMAVAVTILVVHFILLRKLGPQRDVQQIIETAGVAGAPTWSLAPQGGHAGAFFWKSTVAFFRRTGALVALAISAGILSLPIVLRTINRPDAAQFVGTVALVWGGMLLLVGPQLVRNDIRRDQDQLGLLRMLPVRGASILLGGAASAALLLASGVGVLLLTAVAAMPGAFPGVNSTWWPRGLFAAIPLLFPVALAGVLIQDAALVLLPAWSRLTAKRGSAVAVGSNLANTLLTTLCLGVLLLLPALAVRGLLLIDGTGLAAAGLVAAVVLLAECVLLGRWLGRTMERRDMTKTDTAWRVSVRQPGRDEARSE